MNTTIKHTLYGVSSGLLTVAIAGGVLLSSAAQAQTPVSDQPLQNQGVEKRGEFGKHMGKGGAPLMLKEVLGLTDEEVKTLQADTSGKTFEQLLAEKNLTKDALKAKELSLMTERFNAEFDTRFENMKTKKVSDILSAPRGEKMGKGGKGMAPMNDEEFAKHLGITVDELTKAKADGTLKDIMQKHRETMKAQNQNQNK